MTNEDRLKPFLLITGMHRSGTSFLSRAFNLHGVYLGTLSSLLSHEWKAYEDNPRGHWENKTIYELAKKTLKNNNGSWHKVPKKIKVNQNIGRKIKKCTNELVKNSLLASGFKDPRLILCFDSWLPYLPKNFTIVGIFRDPLKVAESLKKRNDFDYKKSLELWNIYNQKLLKILEKHNGFLLDFDWPKKKLFAEIELISKKLGLDHNIDLSEWYSKDLFKSDKTFQKDFPLNKEVSILYDQLKQRTKKNSRISVKFRFEQKESSEAILNLLIEIQNQNNYFKILNDQNLKKLEKEKNYSLKLNQEIQNKESELLRNKKFISKITNDLSKKEEEISRKKEYLTKLPKELQDKQAELTHNKEHITKLTKDLQDKDAELSKVTEHTSKLTKDLQDRDAEISKVTEHTSKLTKDLQDRDAELSKVTEHTSKLTKDLQDRDAELSKVTEHTSKLTKEIEDKVSEIKRDKDFVTRLSTELVEKKDEIKSLENQIKGLEENINSLRENRAKYYSSRL